MTDKAGEEHGRVKNRQLHMANERTFLAWIRTTIGIMAFGFVVEKFSLFLKYMSHYLDQSPPSPALPWGNGPSHQSVSSYLGMVLIGLGALMGILAFVRYKRTEREIDEEIYHPSLILDILLTISIVSIAVLLLLYLRHTL